MELEHHDRYGGGRTGERQAQCGLPTLRGKRQFPTQESPTDRVVGHGDRARVLVFAMLTPLAVSRPGGLWGLVTDGHDRRSPNAEGVIRVVETDTHGKALGEADPVELPVDLRQPLALVPLSGTTAQPSPTTVPWKRWFGCDWR